MTNLFSRLFRYRPTAGRVPWEDHFTESFAAVLDHYPKLREGYAGHLIGRSVEAVIIDTQRTFDDARPDMWIDARDVDDRRHVVMVEHKMGAPAEWPQLKAYEERLRRVTPAETRTLVHIAGSSAAPCFEASGGVEFRCFKWFQIYRWLQRRAATARSRGQHMEFVDEFLKFMGERGMTIEIEENLPRGACERGSLSHGTVRCAREVAAWLTGPWGRCVPRRRAPTKYLLVYC